MYYAIVTRYHGPTNFRHARISASTDGCRRYTAWDHALNADGNHRAAAEALAAARGWLTPGRTLEGGALPNGRGYAWVFIARSNA